MPYLEEEWVAILNRVVGEAFTDEVTSEQKPKERKGARYTDTWELAKGKSCLAHSRTGKDTSMAKRSDQGEVWEEMGSERQREWGHTEHMGYCEAVYKDLGLTLR